MIYAMTILSEYINLNNSLLYRSIKRSRDKANTIVLPNRINAIKITDLNIEMD